jgi:hypothetical protein
MANFTIGFFKLLDQFMAIRQANKTFLGFVSLLPFTQ